MFKHLSMTRALSRTLRGGAVVMGAAAIGVGALAGPASADHYDWSGVAQCESGGNWGINTGNGYHGGLQFSPSTWNAYGGQEYAASASQASREQQIAVAERVLAGQGWGAWPSCSSSLGLSSAPTQRSVDAAPSAPAETPAPTIQNAVPQLPETPAVPAEVQGILAGFEQGVTALQEAGVELDPNILDAVRAVLPQ